jgi:hypothetical protein
MSNLYREHSINTSYQVSVQLAKVVSEENIFRNRPIRNKNCLWWPYLLMDRDEMSTIYRRPPIDDTYQVSVHLAKRFQRRRFFRNQPIRNKNCLWWPNRYYSAIFATLQITSYVHSRNSSLIVCRSQVKLSRTKI